MDDMDNKSFRLALLALAFALYILLGISEARGEMTTCRLASQILGNKQRVCVFTQCNHRAVFSSLANAPMQPPSSASAAWRMHHAHV